MVKAQKQELRTVITPLARWKLLDGEAGFDGDIFTIASGKAELRSFCTGETLNLVGGDRLTVPSCPADISGKWGGNYTRRLPLETGPPVGIGLDLKYQGATLQGEVTLPDGKLNIVSGAQSEKSFSIEAVGVIGGKERRLALSGEARKGEIDFQGLETGLSEKPLKLLGEVHRFYIADSALPESALGQPFRFDLTAVSTNIENAAFRLTSGRFPTGVTLDPSGLIAGVPDETGRFDVQLAAEDGLGGSFEQKLTLVVKKMVVVNRFMPAAIVGQPYSTELQVIGGKPPYRFSGIPPKGMVLDAATGKITGTPTTTRDRPSQFTIRDGQNNSEISDVFLEVHGGTILNSHFLPEASLGKPYENKFEIVGNTTPPTWGYLDSISKRSAFS